MAEKILIIDDEVDLLDMLKTIIEDKTDYQVFITPQPREAFRLLRGSRFDLVITDLRMPDLDGISLLEEIRREDRSASGHHHQRLRHHRLRRGRHAARGLQLHHQALQTG